MAVIPGSTKLWSASGERMMSSQGRIVITNQSPSEEDPGCCCTEENVCNVCHLGPPTDCQTGPGLDAYYFLGFELTGGTPGTNYMEFVGGTMGLKYIGNPNIPPSCIWSTLTVDDSQAYQRGLFNYNGLDGLGQPCTVDSFLFELPNTPPYTIGCNGSGNPFFSLLACTEIPTSWSQYDWYADVIACTGGPGKAWILRLECVFTEGPSWRIDCGGGEPAITDIRWAYVGWRPWTETPENCYNVVGTYCGTPSFIDTVNGYPADTVPMDGVIALSS